MSLYYDGIAPPNGDSYSTLDGYYEAVEVPPNSELTYMMYPSEAPYFDFTREFNMKVPVVRANDYDLLMDGKYQVAELPDTSDRAMVLNTSWKQNPNLQGVSPYYAQRMMSSRGLSRTQKQKLDKLRKQMKR